VPGQVGLLQATEAIKLILKRGNPLIGQFLLYSSLETDFSLLSVEKDPSCSLCSQKPMITELIDYEQVCSQGAMSRSVTQSEGIV
jgi:molybdopterin/thiamine biosynthesis adenylyltransferase